MTNKMFAETLYNSQHLTPLIPESLWVFIFIAVFESKLVTRVFGTLERWSKKRRQLHILKAHILLLWYLNMEGWNSLKQQQTCGKWNALTKILVGKPLKRGPWRRKGDAEVPLLRSRTRRYIPVPVRKRTQYVTTSLHSIPGWLYIYIYNIWVCVDFFSKLPSPEKCTRPTSYTADVDNENYCSSL
jgi:hypothetical protein